jgi:hypothetical protein
VSKLELIDHERNFMLEAVVQERQAVVFVMTNGADNHHRWMMCVDSATARKQLIAFLASIPDDREIDMLHTIKELKERIWLLEETIHELLIYASPLSADLKMKGGFTSELVPRLTRIGPVQVADRLAEIRAIVTPKKDEA